jgi:glycerophosphoryl diester phosphodiesterase
MQWLFDNDIAHRGLYNTTVCENSKGAFRNAIEHNVSIELDVQMTHDEELIVFHDENSFRLTNQSFDVSATSYELLKELKLLDTQEGIPLLQEVLNLIQGKVPVLIDIKNNQFDAILEIKLAKMLDEYKGEVAVCSFNYQTIKWFSQHRPNTLRGLNFGDRPRYGFRDFLEFLYCFDRSEPNFVSLDYALLDTFIVKYCRFLKIPLLCWTIDSQEKKDKALKKVQGIIFEQI